MRFEQGPQRTLSPKSSRCRQSDSADVVAGPCPFDQLDKCILVHGVQALDVDAALAGRVRTQLFEKVLVAPVEGEAVKGQ